MLKATANLKVHRRLDFFTLLHGSSIDFLQNEVGDVLVSLGVGRPWRLFILMTICTQYSIQVDILVVVFLEGSRYRVDVDAALVAFL